MFFIDRAIDNEKPAFKSKSEAIRILQQFLDTPRPELKVGDAVVRNSYGEDFYKHPEKNSAAIVTEIYDTPRFNDGKMEDMILCCAVRPDVIMYFSVDSRFYKKDVPQGKVFKLFSKE